MRRIGLLGGTFDPPHQGHLRLAELALGHLELDELRFVPAALSPGKAEPCEGGDQRCRLLEMALEGARSHFRVETIELERPGPSYTVDTLEALAARERDVAWVWILGSDRLEGFERWKAPERILTLAALAVCPRPGRALELPGFLAFRLRPRWSGKPGELILLPPSEVDLASTDLRRALARGEVPEGLPEPVGAFLRHENLYRRIEREHA